MPSIHLAELTGSHVTRLNWFRQRAGSTTRWPSPLPDDMFLVTRPKGIFKPRDLDVALSVRIQLDSPYPDGEIFVREDGTWYFAYHQENADAAKRDAEYANRGLMRCIETRVPVGVLRERVPDKANSDTYDVLGLAMPVMWEAGYFLFEGIRADGFWRLGDTQTDLLLSEAEREELNSPEEAPTDDYDARVRAIRQIVARRGQPKFRDGLLNAYAGACAVTDSNTPAVLEAAHIRPYRGPESNVLPNGLLLRTDIHTLFDLALLAIDPATNRVAISKSLAGSDYAELEGKPLRSPATEAARPSIIALQSAWDRYVDAEKTR